MNNNFCVIMAGGIGSRFWPLSRVHKPKQFLDILSTGQSLLQQTFNRFAKICPAQQIFIVTSDIYTQQILEQLPDMQEANIIKEPARRNTAPCIAYASFKIKQINPNANIVVTPADHLITNESKFVADITLGLDFSMHSQALLTLGIKPSRPETGYGYIQVNTSTADGFPGIKKVKTFTEKPDLEVAKMFMNSGEFFWNSGIFIWSLSAVLNSFDRYLNDVYSLFGRGEAFYGTDQEDGFIASVYAECRNISIDYGVMEKADNVYVLCSDFGWSDLGTWGSLHEHAQKDGNQNAANGDHVMLYDTQNSIVHISKDKIAVIEGLDDYIVAESDGVLLICRKSSEQKIRQFVSDVTIDKGERYI